MPILYPNNITPTQLEKENNEFSSSVETKGLNLTYPFRGEIFAFDTDKTTLQLVKSKIKLLFDIDFGEWRFKPSYGLGIRQYLFENINEATLSEIKTQIKEQIERWIPETKIRKIQLTFDGESYLTINVNYTLVEDSRETESITKKIEIE